MAQAQKKTVFVIQPFGKSSEDIYKLVSAAAAQAGVTAMSADSVIYLSTANITETIHQAILDASLLVADFTDANSNVMYEVGFAQAQKKPLIFIASSSRSIPFDLAGVPVVIYDFTNPDEFVQRLSKMIAQAVMKPEDFWKVAAESAKRPKVFISYSHSDAST